MLKAKKVILFRLCKLEIDSLFTQLSLRKGNESLRQLKRQSAQFSQLLLIANLNFQRIEPCLKFLIVAIVLFT